MPARDPYAATAIQDPYAATALPAAQSQPPAWTPPAGNVFRAAPGSDHNGDVLPSGFSPSTAISNFTGNLKEFGTRLRNTVANSAIGYAVESTMPKLADELNIHPTETVNSPTYQTDKNQLLAPQYLAPAPTSAAGHVARGVLTGAGQLTSGKNLATAAAIAATSGLAAPVLAGAGTAAAVGRAAQLGMNLGFAGMGAKGVYDDASHAYQQYDAGDTDGALESLGAAVPNAALTLPALAPHIETFGDATQDAGVNLMDSYLKAGKRAYRYDAQPGRGILDEGPGTSIGLTRQGFSDKVAAAKAQAGAAIPDIVNASTAQIPRSELADNVNSVISRKNTVLTGAGGNPDAIAPLDTLAATFDPHTQVPGNASLAEVYGIKRNQDKNINWSRDIDPIAATRNNANREIRSNMAQSIYAAEPALEAPSQQYSNLASAAKLADARTYDTNGSVFNPFRMLTGTVGGIAAGELTHNPVTGLMTGIATNVAPELWKSPAAKTTAATALFQGGKGISAFGRALQGIPGMPQLGTSFSDTNQYPQEYDGPATSAQNQAQHLPLPGTGVYARTNVTPEIIRPGDMSRSQIGVGPDGRAGVMIRPLAALPAPVPPVPEATPYTFEGPKLGTDIAIPQRSPMALQNSIGSSAHTIPASLLSDILPQGTPEEQAAALRLASLGSRASVVPLRSVIANPNSQPRAIGGARLK